MDALVLDQAPVFSRPNPSKSLYSKIYVEILQYSGSFYGLMLSHRNCQKMKKSITKD